MILGVYPEVGARVGCPLFGWVVVAAPIAGCTNILGSIYIGCCSLSIVFFWLGGNQVSGDINNEVQRLVDRDCNSSDVSI